MISLKQTILIDIFSWLVFGILWILFPNLLLTANFGKEKFDWITIHLTRVFGLFCIYSVYPSYMAYQMNDEKIYKQVLIKKLLLEIILLGLMIISNNKIGFGLIGICLCIGINSIVLLK
tara:strand:- start:1543 stop:1899 length:357 start_codon:yes stop_codon:yes gene_type:complete